jgi:hypothetical protein
LWVKAAASRLAVDEGAMRRSLASVAPIAAARLDPGAALAVNLEKGLLGWVLSHPEAVPLDELELWAQEFENQECRELLNLVIRNCREHGRLDHGLLVQQVDSDRLRQQICTLTLEEEKFNVLSTERLTDHWRRDLEIRRLKKVRARLKERLKIAAGAKGDEDLATLLAQRQEIDRQLEALKIGSTAKGENG